MITFDRVGSCENSVSLLIEGYSGKDGLTHGSLDVTIRSCVECHQDYRDQLYDCGMTAYSYTGSVSHAQRGSDLVRLQCGDRTTFAENTYTTTYEATGQHS